MRRATTASRALSSVAARLHASDAVGADVIFWRQVQLGRVLPELDAHLEAARAALVKGKKTSDGTANAYESRSALAVALAKRWSVDQVSADKKPDSVTATYALRVDEGVDIGFLKATIWPEGPDGFRTALLHSLHCDPAIPTCLAGYPLITKARETLVSEDIGVKRVLGIVPLPGLCQWLTEERSWERVDADATAWRTEAQPWALQREAVEAIARGQPRAGCEAPYDEQTLLAAQRPIEGMALEYAALEDVDSECTAMALAGGRLAGVHYLHDKSEASLRSAAGCTASFEFDTDEVRHIDLDDKLADHTEHTPHPAEGSPGRW